MPEAGMTFEEALSRLEEIVRQLESGELTLDETVRLYEEGQRLLAFCQRKLADAEKRIKVITVTEEGSIEVQEWDENF
ncbi:MAG: exodeoxyribonuclease VII small subunit [Candidatus Fervidibacterota bacterium]